MKYLDYNKLQDDSQSGFRKHRSIYDQTTYLAQEIEEAFQNKSKPLAHLFRSNKDIR